MNILIVVDMQNDFIDGSLGTNEAVDIVPRVVNKVKSFIGEVIFTMDTHQSNYLTTVEGVNLPIKHCIEGTKGWNISSHLLNLVPLKTINKSTFGCRDLPKIILDMLDEKEENEEQLEITLVGLCTDICVISNAIVLKTFFPESKIIVDENCCAGVTPLSHKNAINSLKVCHIIIENEVCNDKD